MPVHIHHEVETIYDISVLFDLIKGLAPYSLIYIGLLMFRKEIAAILRRVKGFKGAGFEAILDQADKEATQKTNEIKIEETIENKNKELQKETKPQEPKTTTTEEKQLAPIKTAEEEVPVQEAQPDVSVEDYVDQLTRTAEEETVAMFSGRRAEGVHPTSYADLFPSFQHSLGISEDKFLEWAKQDSFNTIILTFQELNSLVEEAALIHNLRLGRTDNAPSIALLYYRGYISKEDVHSFFLVNGVRNKVQHSSAPEIDEYSAEIFVRQCYPLILKLRESIEIDKNNLEKWKSYAKDKIQIINDFISKTENDIKSSKIGANWKIQITNALALRGYFEGAIDGYDTLFAIKPPNIQLIYYAINNRHEGLKESYAHGYYAGYFPFGNHPSDVDEFYWPPHLDFLSSAYGFPMSAIYGGR